MDLKGNCVIHVSWLETCRTTTPEESELPGICLVGGPLNNWWRRLNIAAQSIYPKHSRAVIYLKLSFPDCCFLLLFLGSRPSLIIANPGHLAFHYRHSGRKGRQEQPVRNNTTSHTRRGRGSQFTGTHRHKEDSQTGSCVMLKATVAMLKNKMNWTRKICFCIPWFGLEYVPCWIWYTQNHTHTCRHTSVTDLSNRAEQSSSNLCNNVHTHTCRGALWSIIIPEYGANHCSQ